jgi:hypothetical protein
MFFGSKYIVYIPWNLPKKTISKSTQEKLSKFAPNQVQETQQNNSPNDPNNQLFKSAQKPLQIIHAVISLNSSKTLSSKTQENPNE